MKSLIGSPVAAGWSVAFALWQVSMATEVPNGSFESGLDGWSSGGHVSIESAAPYAPTEGTKLAAFNAVNSSPDGWISRVVEIPNTIGRFRRLRMDVGNLGFMSADMRLRVEIDSGVATERVDQVVTVPGTTGGATRWQEASFVFANPVTGQVTIRLTDVSTATANADLVVDHLHIDDASFLNVNSADDMLSPGLPVSVAPADARGLTGAGTPVHFQYFNGESVTVTVTVPGFSNGRPFLRWRKNGSDAATTPTTQVSVDGDVSLVAIYDPPFSVRIDPSAEARGFVRTGPFSPVTWTGYFHNSTGMPEAWSAVAAVSPGSGDPLFFRVEPNHGVLANDTGQSLRVFLTDAARDLQAGVHHGRVEIHSEFGTAVGEITLRMIEPEQHLENAYFQQGLQGWEARNHVSLQSAAPYQPTFGTHLVAFNAVDSTPDGVLSQTIPTEPGVTYLFDFDMGVLSYNTGVQRLKVEVAYPADNPAPCFSQTLTMNGVADGRCHWERKHFTFTADGDFARITFSDVSPETGAIDLLLDNILVRNHQFNLMVTTLADENDPWPGMGSGDSLREVLARADAIPGTNHIYFLSSLEGGTITLGGSELHANSPVSITGWTAGVTVSGNGLSRVLHLGADSYIHNLTLTGGAADIGGGIHSEGDLMLTDATVSNNHATTHGGGLYANSPLVASRCRLTGNQAGANGGAANTWSDSWWDACLISANSAAANGGGLTCGGGLGSSHLVLTGSTVSGNGAGISGGGYSGLSGYKVSGNLYSENSTFAGNTSVSSGGAIHGQGIVDLEHATISNNSATGPGAQGGGIANALLEVENTIISGNTASSHADLSSDISGYNFNTGPNLIGGSPQLDALGDHGGPVPTMPPLPGSPAIDAGLTRTGESTTDQRGSPRLSGPTPDLGAVELRELIVNTLADENDGPAVGNVSLRDALGVTDLELIRFNFPLNGGTIVLDGSELELSRSTNIDASDLPGGLTVSANHASPVMAVRNNITASIRGLTFADGYSITEGGGIHIHNLAHLNLDHCTIRNNESTTGGGGIGNITGWLTLNGCRITGNRAGGVGGGILTPLFSLAFLTDTWIDHNSASFGGGIFNSGWSDLNRVTLSDNHCDANGGGLYMGGVVAPYKSAHITINTSTIANNSAGGVGGGISSTGYLPITHSTITGNHATVGSGGIYLVPGNLGGSLTLVNSILTGNHAPTAPDIADPPDPPEGNLLSGDPKLAPLGDYGGATPTLPPLPGSPAIDAALILESPPATDQRGHPVPIGPLPDIGAVEAFPLCTLALVDSDHDGIDDRLEPSMGLTVGTDDHACDSDGDGSTDAEEIANMTDPSDPASRLKILSFSPSPNAGFGEGNPVYEVRFTTFPGLSYSLECDADLDFTGPHARVLPLGPAGDFTGSAEVELMPGRDFIRVRRDP